MNNNKDKERKKWGEIECPVCKTKFEIWLATSNWFSPEFSEYLRENFYRFCPVCKSLKDLKEKQEQNK